MERAVGVKPAGHAGDGGIDIIDPRDGEGDVALALDRDQLSPRIAPRDERDQAASLQ